MKVFRCRYNEPEINASCMSGVKCSLLTGNERDELPPEEETHISSTIEMLNVGPEGAASRHFDVAVIDEAQLVGDKTRGWAWTQAILGLPCPEIHLCGSPTMLPVIESLMSLTGDELVVKTYERLSPLVIKKNPLSGMICV
jgi:ATP-dependent RNA helicase SUPV3L1/SUV3